jgi:hypothetical protein
MKFIDFLYFCRSFLLSWICHHTAQHYPCNNVRYDTYVFLRLLVRDNQVDYLRAVLHQLPYYIPPVILANLINILIFALMMGAVELLPNLLLVLSGSPKVALPFTLQIYNYFLHFLPVFVFGPAGSRYFYQQAK